MKKTPLNLYSLYLSLQELIVALLLQPLLEPLNGLGGVLRLLPEPGDLVLALLPQSAEGVVQLLDLPVEGGHVAVILVVVVVLDGPGVAACLEN